MKSVLVIARLSAVSISCACCLFAAAQQQVRAAEMRAMPTIAAGRISGTASPEALVTSTRTSQFYKLSAKQQRAFNRIKAEAEASRDLTGLSPEYLKSVAARTENLESKLDKSTQKVLADFQKKQERLIRKVWAKDSSAGKQLQEEAIRRKQDLLNQLEHPEQVTHYIPYLDTLKTSLKYVNKYSSLLNGQQQDLERMVGGSLKQVSGLENSFKQSALLQDYLGNGQQQLRDQLQRLGFTRELKQLNKQLFYYKQQVEEYKAILSDPKKAERKAINLLSQTKVFQDFMRKNSILSTIFRMPTDDPDELLAMANITGLQTRASINQLLQQQMGAGGEQALQQLRQNIQHGYDMLEQVRSKINEYGTGASDGNMPNFKPNTQKSKSFLKRLEYGSNVQSLRPNGYFPVTSDIGLSVGYKLNDKSVIGVGASYKLGWGKDIRHIQISHQGAGLRSYVDYKLKKSFWLSGGYEMNYRTLFNSVEELKDLNAWQQSGLIGVSRKLPFGSKLVKDAKIQLLWDFLSQYQVPRTQAIIFRVGYNF